MSFSEWKETELGFIPFEWSVEKIGEISEVMSGGTPSTKKEEYYGGEISWITPKDLSGYTNKYIFNGERSITEEGLNNSSAKIIPKNSVLFSSRAPIGYVAIAGVDLTTNQGFKNLVCDSKLSDYNFMYYKMKSLKESFEHVAGGSTFKEVSAKVVKDFKIVLPPLKEQKAIADILSSLDDKIELNNQMNETLEEMAQALFKRWFVDFEFPNKEGQPYKSSGGEMIESELGMIPKGWNIEELGNVLQIRYGRNLPQTKLEDEGYPVFGGNGVIGYFSEFMYREPQVLVSCRGAASGKVLTSLPNSYVTNNSLVLESNDRIKFEYLSEYSKFNMFYQYATGSAQPQITITNLNKAKILLPIHSIINDFSNIINSINTKKLQLKEEQDLLMVARDTLLPKLLSGEIRVSDLEE